MKLYVIEYYDIDLDETDYATATGNNINDAAMLAEHEIFEHFSIQNMMKY